LLGNTDGTGDTGSKGDSINAATLLQFNAAIIVGVLFFLTLSSGLFGQEPVKLNRTDIGPFEFSLQRLQEDITNTWIVSGLHIQIGLTGSIIFLFGISSLIIIFKDGKELVNAKRFTMGGLILLMAVLFILVRNSRLTQF
jgi:hypothetical protein